MRNKFVYSCSIKILTSGFSELLESIFCLLLVMEGFYLQKVVKMLEEMIVSWREVRWTWLLRWNLRAQFVQLLNHWLCDMLLGIVMGKNWALSVDQSWLQVLQFAVHLINLLSILLRCNGFTGIQKAVVDQTGSRPPNSDHDLFGASLGLWEVLWSFSVNHWDGHHQLSYKIHFLSQSDRETVCCFVEHEKTLQNDFLKFFGQLMRQPLMELFYLSSLLQY